MNSKKEPITTTIASLLAALLFYAAMSKLMNYEQSRNEMLNQVFPRSWAIILTWLIPGLELLITLTLLFKQTLRYGLWAATLLLGAFSIYIAVVMTGVFGRVPCSCGGILKNMGYPTHLLFNLFFVAIGITGIKLTNHQHTSNNFGPIKERRHGKIA
ncbi:MAG: hypothetical protein EOO88_15105 [Pedobacter sp.]|nr:MAG: hypothetical protein EOO88_15105 [Pedobacter sp.]